MAKRKKPASQPELRTSRSRQARWWDTIPDAVWAGWPGSRPERMFLAVLMLYGQGIPEPRREFAFAGGERAWRFDFCWPTVRPSPVAVEIDGGTKAVFVSKTGKMNPGGSHNSDNDRWKRNAAHAIGWRILAFTPEMLEEHPEYVANCVRTALAFTPAALPPPHRLPI